MAKSKTEKKRLKRKKKKKQVKAAKQQQKSGGKGWFFLAEADHYFHTAVYDKAVMYVKKAAKAMPKEEDVFHLMGAIANETEDSSLEIEALLSLEKLDKLDGAMEVTLLFFLFDQQRYQEALIRAEKILKKFSKIKIDQKRLMKAEIKRLKESCLTMIEFKAEEKKIIQQQKQNVSMPEPDLQSRTKPEPKPETQSSIPRTSDVPDIPITCRIEHSSFLKALSNSEPASRATYDLAVLSHKIRFTESFETLVCLSSLKGIHSFWYQEETAKKVLKQFRGRALLSDEVGLGKTIEALMILSEYIKRGMVKSFLILTPAPLVSQWKEEMKSKFNLDVPSTDDKAFKSGNKAFWEQPFVAASINQAKSKKNSRFITSREYDMIIVDEAHHLKNRSTLNFKLVNTLKKRFILLLTATPVENNLMELYNLITLLKPGQLETATAFRKKFMTKGDPTDPKNRALLKELLNQVMIRNTRALAGIKIPSRYAETIRIDPTKKEKAFYERLEALIVSLNRKKEGSAKMVVKNLLAQAGSSPKAVALTLKSMFEKEDYIKDHAKELKDVVQFCEITLESPKNRALLKLIKSQRDKLIVFVKYRGTIEYISKFLEQKKIEFSLFHGSMSNSQKDAAIDDFKQNSQVLVTTEIGGEGRNLQFCSKMVNYDLPWNPMKIEQRIGRIHRIGQKNEVQIYNFCATGSIEDYILDILDRKINMFEMVIGEIDMILGRVRGEKEFGDIVYDIWVDSESEKEKKKSFTTLGAKLKRAKTGYNKTRDLDDKLFGDTYEL